MTESPNDATVPPELPRGPGAAFTFTYYFSGAALITAFLAVKTLGVGLNTGITGQLALAIGTVGGLLGTLFNRARTLEVKFSSRKKFARQLEQALLGLGYLLTDQSNGILTYQRSRLGRLFSGDIYVQLQEESAIIVSRAGNIRSLEKHLT